VEVFEDVVDDFTVVEVVLVVLDVPFTVEEELLDEVPQVPAID
jgi:hypothetical protein